MYGRLAGNPLLRCVEAVDIQAPTAALLVELGASGCRAGVRGETAWHVVTRKGHNAAARALAARGAPVAVGVAAAVVGGDDDGALLLGAFRRSDGLTALSVAVESGSEEIVRLLLSCKPTSVDSKTEDALRQFLNAQNSISEKMR